MTPENFLRLQAELVHKLAARASARAENDSLDFLTTAEIEALVWGYPGDPSEPLVLFAMMTHPNSPGKAIPEDEFSEWLSTCSGRLCLEWLRRQGAVLRYDMSTEGASWHTDPRKLTSDFLNDLKDRNPTLHHFASYVMRHALGLLMTASNAHAN